MSRLQGRHYEGTEESHSVNTYLDSSEGCHNTSIGVDTVTSKT